MHVTPKRPRRLRLTWPPHACICRAAGPDVLLPRPQHCKPLRKPTGWAQAAAREPCLRPRPTLLERESVGLPPHSSLCTRANSVFAAAQPSARAAGAEPCRCRRRREVTNLLGAAALRGPSQQQLLSRA